MRIGLRFWFMLAVLFPAVTASAMEPHERDFTSEPTQMEAPGVHVEPHEHESLFDQAQVQSPGIQVQVAGPGAETTAIGLHHIDLVLDGQNATPADTQIQTGGDWQFQYQDSDGEMFQLQTEPETEDLNVINRAPNSAGENDHASVGGASHDTGAHNGISGGDGMARK